MGDFKKILKVAFVWPPWLVYLLLLPVTKLHAQSPPAGYRQFTANNGLPSSEVYEMVQDRQGYLWFGTDAGVSRYNGYKFENFGALQGLTDPVVFYLQEDRRGRIWMKGMSDNLFYFENDSIYAFAGNQALESLKGRSAGSGNFYVDSLGQVFSSISAVGLIRFSPTGKGDFLIKDTYSNSVFLVENKSLNVSCSDLSDKNIFQTIVTAWVEKKQWPLTIYRGSQKFEFVLPEGKEIINLESWFFQDETLVVARTGYLFGFREGKLIWQIPFPATFFSWHQNSRGEIYLGMGAKKGVRRYRTIADIPLNRFETLLEGYSIAHVLEDQQGGYWFATTEAGVFYKPNPEMDIFNKTSGFPVDLVSSVALKNEQEAFVGLDGGGVVKLDARTKKATPLPYVGNRIPDVAYDASQEMLWTTDDGSKLNYFLNGKWHLLLDSVASAKYKKEVGYYARRLHFSYDQKMLWGTYYAGFVKINPSLRTVDFRQGELINQKVPYTLRTLDAYTSSDNRTWIANVNGLFELKNKQLVPPEKQHPAFVARIQAIEELPDSTLVIGSKGYGLVFWKGERIASLTEADGLTSNMIVNLHVDGNGQLWAGTRNGLNKVRWRWDGGFDIETMTTAHGLPSNEITDIASWGNVLWVGTISGLARFSAQNPNPISPKPQLISIITNRRPLDKAAFVHLPFSENNLTINYYTINFKMNGHIPYRYRFDGYDWAHTFNTSLNLPSLPAGKRHFEVQSQNEDGVWSESASFRFYIRRPWWQAWWFWTAVAVAALFAIWVFIRYRTSQVRQEEQMKTEFYKKLSELEMTALRSQMNPHFIFNCLNSINHFVIKHESQKAANYISKFSRLMRLMLDNSQLQKVPLKKELEALELYMELEAMRFDGKFRYELWLDDEVDAQFTQVPPMLIQPYVENAIWHGLMHKPEGGSVIVDVKQPSDNILHVEITDDGVGRDRAAELESKTVLKHKPHGTSITAERLRLLNPENPNAGKVMIHDLMDTEGQPCGTRVILEIPV